MPVVGDSATPSQIVEHGLKSQRPFSAGKNKLARIVDSCRRAQPRAYVCQSYEVSLQTWVIPGLVPLIGSEPTFSSLSVGILYSSLVGEAFL